MSIEVTIIYSPESVNISKSKHIFPDEGGTLGRSANNFWVLEDPNKYMSSVHAKIAFVAGQYSLTDLSTNGSFINGAQEPVGNGNQVILTNGDHFTISDYEFSVCISDDLSLPMDFSVADNSDPFADLGAARNNFVDNPFHDSNADDPFAGFSSASSNNDPFAPIMNSGDMGRILPSFETAQQTDPLALLDKAGTNVNDTFNSSNHRVDIFSSNSFNENGFVQNEYARTPIVEHNNVVNDSVNWPKVAQESSIIPDDWDNWNDDLGGAIADPLPAVGSVSNDPFSQIPPKKTGDLHFNEPSITASANSLFELQSAAIPATASFDDIYQSFEAPAAVNPAEPISTPLIQSVPVLQTEPKALLQETPYTRSEAFDGASLHATQPPLQTRSEAEYLQLEQHNQQLRNEVAELKMQLTSAQQVKTPSSAPLNADVSAALNMVVDAMGLTKWNLDDTKKIEINETVGLLMRETMQGMMQVLKFRKKIKEEFRINVTTIQSIENNPLKFSANIDDALENMFIKENNAYKAPVDAVKEGFQGIAEHQVAVVAGMQAAFRGMIERFNPTNLEHRFEKYKSPSLLSLGKTTKRWNAYKEYHQGLIDNLDDSFQHLFGYDFVQAYEEQMQNLISARVSAMNNNESTN